MKNLKEHLNESLISEAADKAHKSMFGIDIKPGPHVIRQFSELGMDFRHKYDIFKLYEDGSILYTNPQLFTGTITGCVKKYKINTIISPDDVKTLSVKDNEIDVSRSLDISLNPYNYFRAVLNALVTQSYTRDQYSVILSHIDYTKKDMEKDIEKNTEQDIASGGDQA